MMNFFHQRVQVTTKCVPPVENVSNNTGFYLLIIYYMPGTVLGI